MEFGESIVDGGVREVADITDSSVGAEAVRVAGIAWEDGCVWGGVAEGALFKEGFPGGIRGFGLCALCTFAFLSTFRCWWWWREEGVVGVAIFIIYSNCASMRAAAMVVSKCKHRVGEEFIC